MPNTRTIVHPVVGFGGTNLRVALAERDVVSGKLSGMPKILHPVIMPSPKLSCSDNVDLDKALSQVRNVILSKTEKCSGTELVKFVGWSLPGAWLESGVPYPGTTPNIPGLRDFHLADEFASMMGPGWRVAGNNDGVVQVFAQANLLLKHLDLFPHVRAALSCFASPKIAGLVPGTGCGGGFMNAGKFIVPVSGPQQVFDFKLWPGLSVIPGSSYVLNEDAIAGVGFSLQARNSFLKHRYSEKALDRRAIGPLLSRMAFSGSKRIKADEKEFALGVYRNAVRALKETMELTFNGGDLKGRSRKAVVNSPAEVEANFWSAVRGTTAFILGGWLADPMVKPFIGKELKDSLDRDGQIGLQFVFSDDIPGVDKMVHFKPAIGPNKMDITELVGASLLMPENLING